MFIHGNYLKLKNLMSIKDTFSIFNPLASEADTWIDIFNYWETSEIYSDLMSRQP